MQREMSGVGPMSGIPARQPAHAGRQVVVQAATVATAPRSAVGSNPARRA